MCVCGGQESDLSQLFDLGSFDPDDAPRQTLVDQQAQLAVEVNAAVVLVLQTRREQTSAPPGPLPVADGDDDATAPTSSRVGMIFSRIFPMVSMLAFTLRILSGTILVSEE